MGLGAVALPASILPKEVFSALIDAFAFSYSTGLAGGCLANAKAERQQNGQANLRPLNMQLHTFPSLSYLFQRDPINIELAVVSILTIAEVNRHLGIFAGVDSHCNFRPVIVTGIEEG